MVLVAVSSSDMFRHAQTKERHCLHVLDIFAILLDRRSPKWQVRLNGSQRSWVALQICWAAGKGLALFPATARSTAPCCQTPSRMSAELTYQRRERWKGRPASLSSSHLEQHPGSVESRYATLLPKCGALAGALPQRGTGNQMEHKRWTQHIKHIKHLQIFKHL